MKTDTTTRNTLVLMILDGWGYNPSTHHNAIANAHTPHWDHWWQTCPHLLLEASGEAVGLPTGQMGNSEVGHMHIGAGRILFQDYSRINHDIKHGQFAQNPVFLHMIEDMKQTNRAIHVMGLLSDGGVHSHEQHLYAFLELCYQKQFSDVYLHLFLDGRDTPPKSALHSLSRLTAKLKQYPVGRIASITGRYFAMDRDNRWERIAPLYQILTSTDGASSFTDAHTAIETFYQQGITDEFIPPTRISTPISLHDGDSIFFFNFRSDRARQLTEALISTSFDKFSRQFTPKLTHKVSMTQYADYLDTKIAFPPQKLSHTLGDVLATHGLHQLRLAETEKYAHVTFFFNGGIETPFPHETRLLIPSPKVNTYNLQPEMSGPQITKALLEAIQSQQYDVIICNYANADMVAHTGDYTATIKAIEYLDAAIYQVVSELKLVCGQLLITADHGNADCMFDDNTQQPHTAHTNEPVPLLFIGDPKWQFSANSGSLCDIAPTILHLLHLDIPNDMTGKPLLTNRLSHEETLIS